MKARQFADLVCWLKEGRVKTEAQSFRAYPLVRAMLLVQPDAMAGVVRMSRYDAPERDSPSVWELALGSAWAPVFATGVHQ